MVSRRDLEVQRQLLAVGEARTAQIKGRLAEAEAHRSDCDDQVWVSQLQTGEAFDAWSASIGSHTLGPSYVLAAGDRLLAAESGLVGARKQLDAATREAEEHAAAFRAAEARRSNETDRFRQARRTWTEKLAEKHQDEVQEILLGRSTPR